MLEQYFYIEPETARELLRQVQSMTPQSRGIDRRAFLIGGYAVLATERLKLRNVDVRDDGLEHLNAVIRTLAELHARGVRAVPLLGWCCEEDSPDGRGYLFAQRAKGSELYDDAAICPLEVWTQGRGEVYLRSDLDAGEYILARTAAIADVPQEHFDRFIADILAVLERDILIDFHGKSNFFYDEREGFQLIDLDAHTDWYYGLTRERIDSREAAALGGFVPCHFAEGTQAFAAVALAERAMLALDAAERRRLARDNLRIFEKCRLAMLRCGIGEAAVAAALRRLRIFGREE
ncbi:MAG: hypothetical protein IJU78_02085 [Clostridia bacterium]|nr:hypothetical protein [Clostridia bacterium]